MSAPATIGHDRGCLAVSVAEAHCSCSRRDWMLESVPRWQARREVFDQITRWAAEKTVLAEGHITDSTHGMPVFEAEAHKATARMAAAMYIQFGHMARKYLDECRRIEDTSPAQKVKVVDVELPLFGGLGECCETSAVVAALTPQEGKHG